MSSELAQFEAAVLVFSGGDAPGHARPSAESLAAASSYIQGIASKPDSYVVCMQLLNSTQQPAARFFALRAVTQFISSSGYAALDNVRRAELRVALMRWAQARGGVLLSDPTYVRTKLAVALAAFVRADYPDRWPSAWSDILQLPGGFAAGPMAPEAGADLVLRVLTVTQTDIADPAISRSPSELTACGAIKDAIRSTGAQSAIVDFLFAVLGRYCVPAPPASAGSHGGSDTHADLGNSALSLFADLSVWCDVRLFASPGPVEMLFRILAVSPPLRGLLAAVAGSSRPPRQAGAPPRPARGGAPCVR